MASCRRGTRTHSGSAPCPGCWRTHVPQAAGCTGPWLSARSDGRYGGPSQTHQDRGRTRRHLVEGDKQISQTGHIYYKVHTEGGIQGKCHKFGTFIISIHLREGDGHKPDTCISPTHLERGTGR